MPSPTSKPRKSPRKPASTTAEAKVFMTGRSQAIRLPLEFRVSGRSVFIKRLGEAIVLLPKSGDRFAATFAALDEFPRDFTVPRKQRQANRRGLADIFSKRGE